MWVPLVEEFPDLLDAETFIPVESQKGQQALPQASQRRGDLLRDVDGPDLRGAEHLLLAVHQLLQEVDRDVVVRREVHAEVRGQEVVDLPL